MAIRDTTPLVQASAVMYGSGLLLLVLSLATWTPGMSPRWILAGFAAISFGVVIHVVRRGDRLTCREATVLLGSALLAPALFTWNTDLDLRAFANGAALPMLGFYAAWFLHPRVGRVVLYVGCAGWLVAIVHHDSSLLTGLAVSLVVQVVVGVEILARVRAASERLANVDMLTGAANRRKVGESCHRHFGRLVERGTPFSVISIDLDGLREVNNRAGHAAGDALLVEAVEHWSSKLRPTDMLARVGGDEFLIVLPGSDSREAMAVKRRLREGTAISWSAGVAQARADDSLSSLMHRADGRMYRQKADRALASGRDPRADD